MTISFEVRESTIEGKGIFATTHINKGEIICKFQGERMSIEELKRKYETGEERVDDPFQIANNVYLDLEEPYIFFNHSCEPNAGFKESGTLFALRDIEKGEEVTFDYSSTEWTDDAAWGMNWTDMWRIPCRCGSKRCRGEIRVFSLLPEETKLSYFKQGALMDFIVNKLKK